MEGGSGIESRAIETWGATETGGELEETITTSETRGGWTVTAGVGREEGWRRTGRGRAGEGRVTEAKEREGSEAEERRARASRRESLAEAIRATVSFSRRKEGQSGAEAGWGPSQLTQRGEDGQGECEGAPQLAQSSVGVRQNLRGWPKRWH